MRGCGLGVTATAWVVVDAMLPAGVDLPTAEQVASYRKHGWYVSGKIIPHELLDQMRGLIHDHQYRPSFKRLSPQIGHSDWEPGHGAGVRNSEFLSVQQPMARRLSMMPAVGAIAARLAGSASIRLFDDQAVVKPPDDGGAVVGWHTDHSYWSTCTSTEMLTAWIPFDDCRAEQGTLMVVDGSHRWPEAERLRGFKEQDLARLNKVLGRDVPPAAIIPLELRKGQVSFHHMRLVHASAANRSERYRVAVAVHLQDEANDYREVFDSAGKRITLPHDRLCRLTSAGTPDYRDPDVFPVLWRSSG
jgi:hypothetical protein